MYKPNFCAECGERIMRPHWYLWTSRRFCPDCAPKLRTTQLLWPTFAGLTLFILGLGAGRAVRPTPPPLVIERRQSNTSPTQIAQAPPPSANTKTGSPSTPTRTEPPAARITTERPIDSPEIVSTCGAMTKKGTPCQRRVRGTGRCWQHKGQPAMIPLEQRLIAEK
ncbi:MAG TPA: hypothetical protein VF658_19570 [Pyrinomonadaceae bacterium]|jgi:hypothetical protein